MKSKEPWHGGTCPFCVAKGGLEFGCLMGVQPHVDDGGVASRRIYCPNCGATWQNFFTLTYLYTLSRPVLGPASEGFAESAVIS